MELKNDSLTLLLVLCLAQDKKLLREIDPVLTFWEKHRDSFSQIQAIFSQPNTPRTEKNETKKPPAMPETNFPPSQNDAPMSESDKKRSPLREIAGDRIWKELNAYFSANDAQTERNIPSE